MRVALVSLESFYDHSLAIDYLVGYAALRNVLAEAVEFKHFVERGEEEFYDVVGRLVDFRPDIVGFNTYVWNIESTIAAAKALKAILPMTVVVFGGMEATFNVNTLLSEVTELDFIVIGEGEIPFSDLLEHLLQGQDFTTPQPGLAWRSILNIPVIGEMGEALSNIDDIPSPFQRSDYPSRGLKRVLYESYRGCAFRCSYCLYQRDYAGLRYFSEDRIKSDLDAILNSGATHLRFVDATFNLNCLRAKNILRHLQGCKTDVCVEVSAEFFDKEMVSLLPQAGIRHVDIGLQSTQLAPLKAVQREWYRRDRFRENVALLRAEPALTLNIELIAGLPGDNKEGFQRSLDEVVQMWPDHISVYRLLGLWGTQLKRDSQQLGLRFSQKPPYELVESVGFSTEELEQVDELTFAHLVLFNLGVGRYALRYLVEVFEIHPSELYIEFVALMTTANFYTSDEIRYIGRHHAYGNRFDQPMPHGLDLERVHQATLCFFERTIPNKIEDHERNLAIDLVDFGYSLANLDNVQDQELSLGERDNSCLRLAPWCRWRSYSSSVIAELERQGNGFEQLTSDEIDTVLFFIHPDLGPAALALDKPTADIIVHINENRLEIDCSLVATLRDLDILV